MIDNINHHIDVNLKAISESKDRIISKYRFIGKEVKRDENRFVTILEDEGLIDQVIGDFCKLSKFGFDVSKIGGWLKHLELKEQQATEENTNKLENEKLERKLKLQQSENLEYQTTIRDQESRIRNLTEDLKFMSLIKHYWWFILTCIGIGWFVGETLDIL
jgi:SMC interacting uncharacterized protein involved in chromosome segregation